MSSIMSQPNLARYNSLADKITPFAKIISWEIPNGVVTTRRDMEQHLVQAGIPITTMQKPLRERARVERSLNVIEVELRKLSQEGVLQVEREDRDMTIWNWMTYRIENVLNDQGEYRQVTTEIPRQFVYDKQAHTVRAASDRLTKLEVQVREYRANSCVRDQFNNRVPFDMYQAVGEIGELRARVRETQDMLDDLLQKFGSLMMPRDIRMFLTKCVERAQGIAFRSRGGAYIIPRPNFRWVEQIQAYLALLGQGCSLKIVNLFDVERLVEGLEEMAQAMGAAIPSDLSDVITMAKDTLASKDDVEAVFTAFESHFVQAIKEKRDALKNAREAGRNTREKTVQDGWLVELADLTNQVEMFAQLLQFNAKDYMKLVRETENDIQDYALEVSRRKSEGNSGGN